MKIHGLQKMTLLDFPGHVACTVFLNGCDFRCPYCHNFDLAEGKARALMEEEDLLVFLKKRTGLLDGVAFTGGEPCLHTDLPALLRRIRELGYAIKLDTNGCHPELLSGILQEGFVDYLAMDIKNSPEKYALTVGLEDEVRMRDFYLPAIRESIRLIMGSGIDYEFRTTVVKELHEPSDFEAMGRMIEGAKAYYLQSFVDRDSVPFAGLSSPGLEEMKTYLEIISPYVKETQLRGV